MGSAGDFANHNKVRFPGKTTGPSGVTDSHVGLFSL